MTIGGGTGGFDVLTVLGTENADTVTSTATTVTRDGTVTLGTGIDRIDITTLGGDDTITLSALPDVSATVDVIVNAGDGNDSINATGLGAAIGYLFRGDAGNDTILGGNAAGRLEGGDGNDTLDGNGGNDQMFGGTGSDLFIWDPGDGSDLIEGDEGTDVFRFNGTAGAAETFTLNAVGTRLEFLRTPAAIDMDIAGVEQVDINALGNTDAITINDISQTDVRVVNVDLGAADAVLDSCDRQRADRGRQRADYQSGRGHHRRHGLGLQHSRDERRRHRHARHQRRRRRRHDHGGGRRGGRIVTTLNGGAGNDTLTSLATATGAG